MYDIFTLVNPIYNESVIIFRNYIKPGKIQTLSALTSVWISNHQLTPKRDISKSKIRINFRCIYNTLVFYRQHPFYFFHAIFLLQYIISIFVKHSNFKCPRMISNIKRLILWLVFFIAS